MRLLQLTTKLLLLVTCLAVICRLIVLSLMTEFSSDGSISNTPLYGHRLESELRALRLSLFDELEKRKIAEGNLLLMLSQWEKIRTLMLEAGLAFPAPPVIGDNMQLEDQEMNQFSQEVVVARFVSEAVGRGQARAEAEETASAILELKDQEIMRLRDRLQYYETVNHEMSQRKLVGKLAELCFLVKLAFYNIYCLSFFWILYEF